jgi:toxin YoeB
MIVQDECLDDLRHWVDVSPRTALRVIALMEAALRDPFAGIGKPEPLKHLGPGLWSRRITGEDRLVYRVYDDVVDFLQARYHY